MHLPFFVCGAKRRIGCATWDAAGGACRDWIAKKGKPAGIGRPTGLSLPGFKGGKRGMAYRANGSAMGWPTGFSLPDLAGLPG